MERINVDELDFTDDYCYEYLGKPFTGIAYEVSPQGRTVCEMEFKDGMQHGLTKQWYSAGQLKVEASYRFNGLHGPRREWYDNRQLKKEEEYENGICLRRRIYDMIGRTTEEYQIQPGGLQREILNVSRRAAPD